MRIGVLTAGGDCPGLNAVIRSVVHRALTGHNDEVIGFEDGFKGLLDGHFRPLDLNAVSGILAAAAPSSAPPAWSGTGWRRPPRPRPNWPASTASTSSSRSAAKAP